MRELLWITVHGEPYSKELINENAIETVGFYALLNGWRQDSRLRTPLTCWSFRNSTEYLI